MLTETTGWFLVLKSHFIATKIVHIHLIYQYINIQKYFKIGVEISLTYFL